jgi:hypothetical protein
MGRNSKLTDVQWEEISKRLLDGEKARALAREFEISEAAIRKRLGAQCEQIKVVANQLVVAETNFRALPISAQIKARTLADRLKSISENLADAAHYGALTAHRLAGIANGQAEKVDDAEPEKSVDALQRIAGLTKMANAASEIGINLLRANKETIEAMNKPEDDAPLVTDTQTASKLAALLAEAQKRKEAAA